MIHLTEIVADALRNARHAKGLNQRELSARSGVPQGHISKIENGAVDLRASSLVALARALDLELMLVPRKSVSAVQSIAGNAAAGAAQDGRAARQLHTELSRLQAAIDNLPTDQMSRTEVAQFQRDVRELGYFRPAMIDLPGHPACQSDGQGVLERRRRSRCVPSSHVPAPHAARCARAGPGRER